MTRFLPEMVTLPFTQENKVSPADSDEDKFPESLPRYFIENCTKPGQRVLDPFIGHGTTALVAEDMGRIPYGMEADGARYEFTAGQLEHWRNIRHDDAIAIGDQGFPKMDFCITSPPYMPAHHKWNPLYGGDPSHAGYDLYLRRMGDIFANLAPLMKRGAFVVVQADNLYHGRYFTPLPRDLSSVISQTFKPVQDMIIQWEKGDPSGRPYTQCLVFKK